jgi:D-ribose pyranose/furanose isomerase RbsD
LRTQPARQPAPVAITICHQTGMLRVPTTRSPVSTASNSSPDWLSVLNHRLPLLGHRNWIVVADAAYPLQSAPGIETILADQSLVSTLQTVLQTVGAATHVRPVIHLDAELAMLPENHAPGIGTLRTALTAACGNHAVRTLPHDEIIAKLDAAGHHFHILLIKTREILPYTSVFVELDCGYWSPAAEHDLRAAIQQESTHP